MYVLITSHLFLRPLFLSETKKITKIRFHLVLKTCFDQTLIHVYIFSSKKIFWRFLEIKLQVSKPSLILKQLQLT